MRAFAQQQLQLLNDSDSLSSHEGGPGHLFLRSMSFFFYVTD